MLEPSKADVSILAMGCGLDTLLAMAESARPAQKGESRKAGLSADRVQHGPDRPPAAHIRDYSEEEWEKFIEEWLDNCHPEYRSTERLAGAGDMGRDVVGHLAPPHADGTWDNYQCKHYDESLQPAMVWVELGKLMVFTHLGRITVPRQYRFIAPRDVGTKLRDLLRRPEKLRAQLIENWGAYCQDEITAGTAYPLTGALKAHVDAFDFSLFGYVPIKTVVEEFRKTPLFVKRFGGGLPDRPENQAPPERPAPMEVVYVGQLFAAYGDHLRCAIACPEDLANNSGLSGHFDECREHFYGAESLRVFSREIVGDEPFDGLKDEIATGVMNTVRAQYADGYARIVATTDRAQLINPATNALVTRLNTADKSGVCHHLVNEGRFVWITS